MNADVCARLLAAMREMLRRRTAAGAPVAELMMRQRKIRLMERRLVWAAIGAPPTAGTEN